MRDAYQHSRLLPPVWAPEFTERWDEAVAEFDRWHRKGFHENVATGLKIAKGVIREEDRYQFEVGWYTFDRLLELECTLQELIRQEE